MVTTVLSPLGVPGTPQSFSAKTPANYPAVGTLVSEFDLYVEGYAGKTVNILYADTTDLMPCYSDPELTQSIANPQVLLTKTDATGVTYGKFTQSIYVPFAYQTEIDSSEQTGVQRVPVTSLDSEDASYSSAISSGGTEERRLRDRFADVINLKDFGQITDSATTNTNTLTAAISYAASQGGGVVELPDGLIIFDSITLPESVILHGQGRDVTILQSERADKVVTMTGDGAGLSHLQLDGINLLEGSIGLFGRALQEISLVEVLIRRFDQNIVFQGGQNHVYQELYTENANKCIRLIGDQDVNNTSLGDEFSGLYWRGGGVKESTVVGLDLTIVDLPVRHNTIEQVDFTDNIGVDSALKITGASWMYFKQCYFSANTDNLNISDNSNLLLDYRQVSNLYFEGGQIDDGINKFDGLCQDIIFRGMELNDCTFQLQNPQEQILLQDCTESGTLFTGETTKISRFRAVNEGAVKGSTSDGTATTVHKVNIPAGEVVQLLVNATAQQVNGVDYADWCFVVGARCAGSTLNFDSQTANFTVGSEIVGATSGASAIIAAQSDSGTTGTLTLVAIAGEFVDNEIISEVDGGTGSATANGSLVRGSASLISTATSIRAVGSNAGAVPAGWGVASSVLGQELLTKVTGAAATEIFWNVRIRQVAL